MTITTNDFSYGLTVKPKIRFKSLKGDTTYFTVNAFDESNPLSITSMDCERGVGDAGSFNITINDNDNVLDESKLRSTKVFIELGKSEDSFETFMIGYGDIFNTNRPVTNFQEYQITGFGTDIQATELFIHRRQTFKRTDEDAKIFNIVFDALTKRLWRPLKRQDQSIRDITGWEVGSGISTKVKTPYTVVDAQFVYLSDFLNQLCSVTGAVWFIDVSEGFENFTLTFDTELHTGVTIKSGDLKTLFDPADKTSYIKRQWGIEDAATSSNSIASRVITTQILDKEPVFKQEEFGGATTLDFRAIAQQIIINNDARRIDSLAFILDKKGDPQSPNSRVNGDICLDVNNTPTGTVLDTFHIDLGSIDEHTGTIEVSDIDVSEKKLEAGQTKIWVRLFQRSGTTGDPTHDPDNTIKWHHNNAFNTVQPYYSATAPEGDVDKKDDLNWNSTNIGPLYACTLFSNIRRLFSRTDIKAINNIRLREVFVPTDFIKDPSTVGQYLSVNLSLMSKPKRSITDVAVTIPNDFIFRPYQVVSFNDGLSDTFEDLQIKRVRYQFGPSGDDPQVGTLTAFLSLGGSYNPLVHSCSCE